MKYFIVEQSKISEYTSLMEQSFGHNNIFIRMSLDGSKGLMQFTDELAPAGLIGFEQDAIKTILSGGEWAEGAEPLSDEERISLMMDFGKKLVIKFQAENSKMIDNGEITEQETLALLNDVDVQALTTALLSGTLKSALYLISSRFIDEQGQPMKSWLSTPRAMAYIGEIQAFLATF